MNSTIPTFRPAAGRHILVIVLALLAMALGGCTGPQRSDPNSGPIASDAPRFRVMTYNIRHGRGMDDAVDLERIARVIESQRPDIVLLQEVDEHVRRSDEVDQAAWLGGRLGMEHRFAPFMDFQGGRYGMALLSRFPIVDAGSVELPPGPREPRSTIHATVVVPLFADDHAFVTLAGVHLDWLPDDAARVAQAETTVRWLDSALQRSIAATTVSPGRGVVGQVLAGDINDLRGSRTDRLLLAAFDEPAWPQPRPTFPADEPTREIDRILSRGRGLVQVSSIVVDEPLASDHRPVVAEFEVVAP